MVAKPTLSNRVASTVSTIENDLAALRRVRARRDELRARIEVYESKHGIPSADIHTAIDDGRLVESNEVCEWIIAHDILQRSAS